MSDEVKDNKDVSTDDTNTQQAPVKEFKDFIGSKEYIDHINSEKSNWTKDFREKETETLRGTLTEEITKELNPEETVSDKKIRLLTEKVEAAEKKEVFLEKQNSLTKVAKENKYEFGIGKVDRYASFGDQAEEMMLEDFKWMQSQIDSEIDKRLKGSYSKDQPSAGKKEDDYDFEAAMKEKMKNIRN